MPGIDDLAPDMGAIGNVARGPKASPDGGQELREFSVKRGDNGGVTVCETYRSKVPEGRRAGPSFPESGSYKENPFSPDDGAGAAAFIKGLMGKIGIAEEPPAMGAVAGPRGAAIRGPMGGVAAAGEPDADESSY